MTFPTSILLVSLILPLLAWGQDLRLQTCSRGNSAKIQPNANAFIGGIISLNQAGTAGYGCGKTDGDMQAFEAIRWVLELLNKKNETIQTELVTDYYVPGIQLGMSVRNYCNRELSAVASVMDIFPEMSQNDGTCSAPTKDSFVMGVIGPSTSGDAIVLSDATDDYKIPVVSYEATATQLTMPGMHPNFMRTISPDGPLTEVIIQVMIKLKWNYVVVVYDSGAYGRQAYNELHARMIANNICLTAGIMVDSNDVSTAKDTLNKVLSANATGVIHFGPGSYAKAIISEGNGMLPAAGRLQWMFTDISLDTVFPTSSVYQRGIILVSAASRKIVEFEDHWIRIDEANPSPENPWFTGWYEDQYNCKFSPGVGQTNCNSVYQGINGTDKEIRKREEFQQGQMVEAAVMAVYTYARALRNAQMRLCPGVPGICPALKAMSRDTFMNDYLKKVDFVFTSDERVPSLASKNIAPYNVAKRLRFTQYGDIADPSYSIYNYNDIETGGAAKIFKFRQVGSYISSYLDLNLDNVGMYSENRQVLLRPLPSSSCPDQGCTPCLGLPSDIKYYFEQGDVIVNGIFSLHQMGTTALTCGPMMSANQYMFLEAMIYGVRKVNQDNTILNNIILGGLGMDDCSSSTLGQAFLGQVQRGNLQIMDQAGKSLDPRKIEAYSAAYSTSLTLPLAEAMNMLMKPMVGYRAGGTQLDDKSQYPYFIRSIPGNYQEMKAIVLFLKRMNWMFVQVVSSDNENSQDMEDIFRKLASKANICIVATHSIGQTSQDAGNVVSGLGVNSATQPTVVLLDTQGIRRLLEAFNNTMTVRSQVALIGTSAWGTDSMVIKDVETAAEGVITLRIKSSTLNSFRTYLSGLSVDSYILNPWFKEWYVAAHNCSLAGLGTGAPCNQSKPITEGANFQLMYEVEGVINAIRAIGYGLDSTLRSYCGPNYNSICSSFLTSKNKGMKFLEFIRAATFNIEDSNPPDTFRFSGSSVAIPFELNSYKKPAYTMIGKIEPWIDTVTITTEGPLTLLTTNFKPSCPAPCLECLFMVNDFDYWYIPGDVVIGGIFDVHYAGNGPFSCGALRARNGALYTEVFNYALQKINSGTSSVRLRNVTLGGLAFDGCSNPNRATAIVNQVHTGMDIVDASGNMFLPYSLISWMSYDSQTTIDTATLVQKLNMPLVSPGATAMDLDNKQKYYTFFRTIPSDSVIVLGMAEFLKEIGKKYVIVLNAPDTSSRGSRDLFRKYLADFGICIVANYEFVTDGSMDVIVNNIAGTQTQVVAVFAEPDNYINDFLAKSGLLTLRYIANRPWGTNIARLYPNQLTDSVFFELNLPNFDDFINYLASRQVGNNSNPWFSDIFQIVMDCDFPGTFRGKPSCTSVRSTNWEKDIWMLSTINAVYALAEGVHRTLQAKCGVDYTTVCLQYLYATDVHALIMNNMDKENFTDITNSLFNFITREANTNYSFKRYTSGGSSRVEGSLDTVGHLTLADKVPISTAYADVKSACAGDCLVCSGETTNLQDYTLVSGDFYIIGLFDVHKQGKTPFTCGDINNKHGLPLLEAFNYALELVNSKKGIYEKLLPGVQLGGVALDICQSPSRAAELVANIQSGNIQLNKYGSTVNPRMVDAYIGPMDTESTIRVADILTQLAIPQISYGATGMDLLDRDKYSYFLRSVPADDKQARAMVSYLRKFNYNNIQVINSFDEVGEPGMLEFHRLAYVNKICITKEYTVGEGGNVAADAPGVISRIASNTDAQVVVLWFKDPLPILEAASSNDKVSSSVLFIATDKWGADPDYLTMKSISNLLQKKNLVILDMETADIPGFDLYLEAKTPDNYQTNPWFKDYFEMYQNCYWDTPAVGRTLCDKSSTIPRADYYKQDTYVLYVMNAVISVARAIDNAIREKNFEIFGTRDYYGAPSVYSGSGERRQYVMKNLLEVNFTDDTGQPFFYTEDGQSDRGFHIYNITNTSMVDFRYENVGSYNDSHFLKLDITYETKFKAHCDADNNGCVCKFKKDMPSRYVKKADGDGGVSVVYIGDIHQASPTDPLACGPINAGIDLQRLLAFLFAIDTVNNMNLPNSLKLDGLALDSCTHGLRLGQDVYNVLSGNKLCDSDNDGMLLSPSSITAFLIDKDRNALPVAKMLSLQNITSISPTAGSALFNNKFMYPYFLRIRADNVQTANVILQMAQQSNWDYLSVVYTDDPDYMGMADSLMDSSRQMNACVGDAVPLPVNATLEDVKLVLQRLSQQVGARAVVLFVDPSKIALLLEATRSLGLTGRFVWVVGADWEQYSSNIVGYEQEFAGALIVDVRSAILASFVNYVKSLNYTNRAGIPNDLFEEIYENFHQCNIFSLEHPSANRFTKICTLDEVITDAMVQQDPSVLYVVLGVYSVAYGLGNIPECKSSSFDIAACLQLQSQSYDKIYRGILGVNFLVPELNINNSFTFMFDKNGIGQLGYVVKNYRISENTPTPYNTYEIGRVSPNQGLTFDGSLYAAGSFYDRKIPASNCAPGTVCSCQLSRNRKWSYSPALRLDPSNVKVGNTYKDPVTGEAVKVEAIPGPGDRFNEGWAIVLCILACIGCVVSLAIFVYLLIMYPIRGGTSILGFIISFGIFLLYLMVFPFIAHADARICGLRRFALGLVYSIVYSALMVKLIDCWRVRAKSDPFNIKYSKLGTPFGFFMVTVFLILVQVMINAEWLILEEPDIVRIFYKNQYWPRCTPNDFYDEGLVLSLVYIMVIIFVSLMLGLATYRTVKNHRESRWILCILIVSVICWVIWCTASIMGAMKMRDAAVVIGLLVNATTMLLLMPIRKLYLLHKYNIIEEQEEEAEKQSMIAASQRGADYNSVYGRQYDNNPKLHDAASTRGSAYAYSDTHGNLVPY